MCQRHAATSTPFFNLKFLEVVFAARPCQADQAGPVSHWQAGLSHTTAVLVLQYYYLCVAARTGCASAFKFTATGKYMSLYVY